MSRTHKRSPFLSLFFSLSVFRRYGHHLVVWGKRQVKSRHWQLENGRALCHFHDFQSRLEPASQPAHNSARFQYENGISEFPPVSSIRRVCAARPFLSPGRGGGGSHIISWKIKGVSYTSVRLSETAGSDSVSLGWKSFSISKQISNAGSTFEKFRDSKRCLISRRFFNGPVISVWVWETRFHDPTT